MFKQTRRLRLRVFHFIEEGHIKKTATKLRQRPARPRNNKSNRYCPRPTEGFIKVI